MFPKSPLWPKRKGKPSRLRSAILIQRWFRRCLQTDQRHQEYLKMYQKWSLSNLLDMDPINMEPIHHIPPDLMLVYEIDNKHFGCHLIDNLKWLLQFKFVDRPTNIFTNQRLTKSEFDNIMAKSQHYADQLRQDINRLTGIDNVERQQTPRYRSPFVYDIKLLKWKLSNFQEIINQLRQINFYRNNPDKWIIKETEEIQELSGHFHELLHLPQKELLGFRRYGGQKYLESRNLASIFQPKFLEKIDLLSDQLENKEEHFRHVNYQLFHVDEQFSHRFSKTC